MESIPTHNDADEAGPEIVSEFPRPPSYFTLYQDSGPSPPEPLKPNYHTFGTPYSTQDMIPDLIPDDKKLYINAQSSDPNKTETCDRRNELKKLNRSILPNVIELIDVLMKNPKLFNLKLDDIEQLFVNMHSLINMFRPHQAREMIIHMMREQIREKRDAITDIERVIAESEEAVKNAHAALMCPSAVDTSPMSLKVDFLPENVEMEYAKSAEREGKEFDDESCADQTKLHRSNEQVESWNSEQIQQKQSEFFSALDNVDAKKSA